MRKKKNAQNHFVKSGNMFSINSKESGTGFKDRVLL